MSEIWPVRDFLYLLLRLGICQLKPNLIYTCSDLSQKVSEIRSVDPDLLPRTRWGAHTAPWRTESPRKSGNVRKQLLHLAHGVRRPGGRDSGRRGCVRQLLADASATGRRRECRRPGGWGCGGTHSPWTLGRVWCRCAATRLGRQVAGADERPPRRRGRRSCWQTAAGSRAPTRSTSWSIASSAAQLAIALRAINAGGLAYNTFPNLRVRYCRPRRPRGALFPGAQWSTL